MDYVWFALIGICAGWLAGQWTKGSGFGLVGNLIVGVIGALLGAFIAQQMGLAVHGLLGMLAIATCGAIILLFLLRLATKKSAA